MLVLATGPVDVFGRTWQIHSLFARLRSRSCSGTQVVQLGIFARTFAAAHLGERTGCSSERTNGSGSSTASPAAGSCSSRAS